MQVFKRFPLLHPLQYLAAPIAKLKALSAMEAAVRNGGPRRIDRRGDTEHVDLFEYVLPENCPVPADGQELIHIGSLAQQMMFANYGPMSDWYYGTLLFLLEEPECLQRLSKEITETIESYQDITPSSPNSLPFLHACLEESLRLLPSNNTGLPRLSPGDIIDGHYVPKGVSSTFPFYSSYFSGGGAIIDPSANINCRGPDPCTNQHLRAKPQSALLPRSTALPPAALAGPQPPAVRRGVRAGWPEGFPSLQSRSAVLHWTGDGVDAGEAVRGEGVVDV